LGTIFAYLLLGEPQRNAASAMAWRTTMENVMNVPIKTSRLMPKVAAALALALACVLPVAANATPIHFSGSVNSVQALGTSPFTVGDKLSGSVNINIESDHSFNLGDLNAFDLTVGPAEFNLSSSDFASLNGQVSSNGATLTDFSLASDFVSVPGLSAQYGLGFNGVGQPFSVTGTDGAIVSGDFTATVGGVTPVPEPPMLALFGLSVLALGFGVRRRRQSRVLTVQ
jgi:hypothetical protein